VVRTVAVILGDNDYGTTFEPLLNSVYRAYEWNGGLSTEVLEMSIRAGIEFHYVAFQQGQCHSQPGYRPVKDTVSYLSSVRVLFDEEAEADILQCDHDSGAWYLELQTGQVRSY
jgi:hypothetical protein